MRRLNLQKILIISFLISILSPVALKADSAGLEISPANAEYHAKPGDKLTGSFNIKNNDIADANITIGVGESLSNPIVNNPGSDSIIKWFNIEAPQDFSLKAGQSHKVQFNITVPQTAPNKVFKPIITISIKDKLLTNNATGATLKEIIPFQMIILINGSGKFDNNINIDNFAANNRFLFTSNAQFNLTISNLNPYVYSKPIIYFHILNPVKDIVNQQTFNDNLKALQLSDKLNETINADVPFNAFKDIGEYTADVLVIDTVTNKSSSKEIKFYFIPYYVLAIPIVILILLIAIVILKKRSKKKKTSVNHPAAKK